MSPGQLLQAGSDLRVQDPQSTASKTPTPPLVRGSILLKESQFDAVSSQFAPEDQLALDKKLEGPEKRKVCLSINSGLQEEPREPVIVSPVRSSPILTEGSRANSYISTKQNKSPHCHFAPLPKVESRPSTRRNSLTLASKKLVYADDEPEPLTAAKLASTLLKMGIRSRSPSPTRSNASSRHSSRPQSPVLLSRHGSQDAVHLHFIEGTRTSPSRSRNHSRDRMKHSKAPVDEHNRASFIEPPNSRSQSRSHSEKGVSDDVEDELEQVEEEDEEQDQEEQDPDSDDIDSAEKETDDTDGQDEDEGPLRNTQLAAGVEVIHWHKDNH